MTASMHDLRGVMRAAEKRFWRHGMKPRYFGWAAEFSRLNQAFLDARQALREARDARDAKRAEAGK